MKITVVRETYLRKIHLLIDGDDDVRSMCDLQKASQAGLSRSDSQHSKQSAQIEPSWTRGVLDKMAWHPEDQFHPDNGIASMLSGVSVQKIRWEPVRSNFYESVEHWYNGWRAMSPPCRKSALPYADTKRRRMRNLTMFASCSNHHDSTRTAIGL